MAQRKRKHKYFLYVLGTLFAFVVLFVGQSFPQKREEVSQMAGFFVPVMAVVRQPVVLYYHFKAEVGAYLFAVENNKKLRTENAHLRAWRDEALFLRAETHDLKALLNMADQYTTNPIAARVLADTRSPYAHTVLVDIGKKKGLTKGQAVLAEGGLAGRVLSVGEGVSRVLLLGDYNARIPVKLLESGTLAIAKGGRYQSLELILTEGAELAHVGEKVVTSGVGGVFAPGIPVGVVRSTEGGRVELAPYVNFTKLDKVLVHRRPVLGILPTNEAGFD